MADSLLSNIRVLDLTTPRAEFAGTLLAQLGAEVYKVEPPGGAAARRLPPFTGGREGDPDGSLYWATVGMGKRSVQLDLTLPEAARRILDFAKTCDVLLESHDPGYLARFGLDYASVSSANPAIVYASVTPYGQDGPEANTPATDLTLEAAGGLLGLQGDGDRPPIPVGFPQAAFHSGAQAAADVIVALNERTNSGLGQHLDVSMQACVVWTLMNATGYPPNTGGDAPGSAAQRALPPPQLVPGIDTPAVWQAKDGHVTCTFALGVLGGRTLDGLIRWAAETEDVPAAITAVKWDTWAIDTLEGRIPLELTKQAVELTVAFVKTRTKRELMDRAVPHNLLLAPIYTTEDLLSDPHLASRDFWQKIGGRVHPGPFAKLSRTPIQQASAPSLAESGDLPSDGRAPSAPPASGAKRSRAFEGLRVADFAWVGVGPIISKALADHGATVVHIESSTRPDVLRTVPPFKDNVMDLDRAQFFANFNSSKLGIALNMGSGEGRQIARRIAGWADVVVESFTPGTMERLGLGYAALSEGRPELIMLSTCLRGQTGPERSYAGFGGQGAALCGLFSVTGWPDRAPRGPWGAFTDFIAPRFGVAALASSILERKRTGLGQHIDLSQVEAGTHFLEPYILDYTVNGRVRMPRGPKSDYAAPNAVFATEGTERYVTVSIETADQWQALRTVAPLDAFADGRYAALAARIEDEDAINAALRPWFAHHDPWDVTARLKAAGVPASVVMRPSDLYADPQLTHRQFFVTREHAVMGPTPYDGHATKFSATPGDFTAAPTLGQHTQYVLSELLKLSEDEITKCVISGALT